MTMTAEQISEIIELAWDDQTSFDTIERQTGVPEDGVIKIMRSNMKPGSFRLWRKRVSGRKAKHEKLLRAPLKPSVSLRDASGDLQ